MSGPKISYASLDRSVYDSQREKAMFDYNVNVCGRYADTIIPALNKFEQALERLDAIECDKEDELIKQSIKNSIEGFKNQYYEIGKTGNLVKQYKDASIVERKKLRDGIPSFEKKYKEAKKWKFGIKYSEDLFFVEYYNEKLSRSAGNITKDAKEIDRSISKFEKDVFSRKIEKNLNSSSYYFAFENANKLYSAKEYVDKTNEALAEIEKLNISPECAEKLENLRQKAIGLENAELIHNFYQISVVPLLKECREYDRFYIEHSSEYETLRISCEILAKELNVNLEEKNLSLEAIEYYREKREELSKLSIEARQQAYIKECLDETMEELGYSLVGKKESTNRRGESFQNELFSYGEGTVVNVTFASNGQITMELGGVDTEDRLPKYAESQKLVESMHMFCSDYERIEEKLEEKGIKNERLSMMPPEEDFAQIINITEYEMNQEIAKFETDVQQAEQTKYMHQGDTE